VSVAPFLAALPWVAAPLVLAWRMRGAPSLDREPADVPPDAPLVSVIVPARNEARNIARCMQSVLDSRYPHFELIVVDDRSEDGTGIIAREIAERDARARVLLARALPEGWFGKQWACAEGASVARGSILCFTDADTTHGPDLLTRAVRLLRAHALDLLSVAGRQVVHTFWERVVQPQIFTMLIARYGGLRQVNRSPRAVDKIANGQYLLFAREAYEEVGGHAAVRQKVAEDLSLAQLLFRLGKRTELVLAPAQLETRMYTSLGELVRGWMKNIYAGAVDAVPFGSVGRTLLPLVLLAFPAAMLAPVVVLVLAAFGLAAPGALVWAIVCTIALLLWWGAVYAGVVRVSPLYALAFPVGAVVVAYIILRAVGRGEHVEWKGRAYRAV
jgi:chlorobactene glucosyltransferase